MSTKEELAGIAERRIDSCLKRINQIDVEIAKLQLEKANLNIELHGLSKIYD